MKFNIVLLIGLNYSNTRGALKACINDLYLTKHWIDTFHKYDKLYILHDDISINSLFYPSKDNITRIIMKIINDMNSSDEDVLFFGFFGHGVITKNEFKILTLKANRIEYMNNFTDLLKKYTGHVIGFMDCCNTGNLFFDIVHNKDFICYKDNYYIRPKKENKRKVLIITCKSKEDTTMEIGSSGIFTCNLIYYLSKYENITPNQLKDQIKKEYVNLEFISHTNNELYFDIPILDM